MKTEFRTYREEDYEAVCTFLIELNRTDRSHINWNWARFEWMYEHPEFDKSRRASIGLWLDGGRVVGAAIYDMYFGEALCGVLPEHAPLFPDVLAYAYRALRDGDGLGVAICDGSARELEAARAAGFAPAEQRETVLSAALPPDAPPALPEGFRFAELDPAEALRAFQWLLWQGFDHGDDRAAFEADYEKTTRLGLQPRLHFRKELSVAAADPAGEYAAYCCLWYREGADYAYVEPVCTVPAYRGKGVGRAVVAEALRRAAALGAKRAYVISDQEFYKKLGFAEDFLYTFYWKRP